MPTRVNLFRSKPVRAFILDITGVLYNSAHGADGTPIPGSIDAINRLYSESRLVFLSNESSETREALHAKLSRLGFSLRVNDLLTPAPVAAEFVRRSGLRPHLLVSHGITSEFAGLVAEHPDQADCVLMADAEERIHFHSLNTAFRVLMKLNDPLLITLGVGKFYQTIDGPSLDVGAFAQALEYATGCRRMVIGKPSEAYFQSALDHLGASKDEVVMIGDDINSDIGGAQRFGIRAIQVRTGKWRPEWERHASLHPDHVADDLSAAVDYVLASSSSSSSSFN